MISVGNYHVDDQNGGVMEVWGCIMVGLEASYTPSMGRSIDSCGLFHDWKMSGRYYNNYADSRVGSPTTT